MVQTELFLMWHSSKKTVNGHYSVSQLKKVSSAKSYLSFFYLVKLPLDALTGCLIQPSFIFYHVRRLLYDLFGGEV